MQSANFELTPSWDDPAVLVITSLSPRRIWGYVHRNGEWFLTGDESLRPWPEISAESFEAAQADALAAADAQLAHEAELKERGVLAMVGGVVKMVLPEELGVAA
jgi:hypothetical protein